MKKIVLHITILLFLGVGSAHAQNESINRLYDGVWTSAQGDTLEIVTSSLNVSCSLCLDGNVASSSKIMYLDNALEVVLPYADNDVSACSCNGCHAVAQISPSLDGALNFVYIVLRSEYKNGILNEYVVSKSRMLFHKATALYIHL